MVEIVFSEKRDGEVGFDGGEAAWVHVSGGATYGVDAFLGGTVCGAEFNAAAVRLPGSCLEGWIIGGRKRKDFGEWTYSNLLQTPPLQLF